MTEVVAISTQVVVLASIYILVALGFAFLFSMLGILNFAHGAIYMIAAYMGFYLIVGAGLNQWLAMAVTTLAMAGFGVFLEKFCFRPFVGNFTRTVMVCIGIASILVTTINIRAGTESMAIPSFVKGVLRAGMVSVSWEKIVTLVIGVVLLVAVIWFFNRTQMGQQMQAVAQNMVGAALQGISIHRSSAIATALGCALAAIAGCLMGAYLNLGPYMGDFMLIKVLILVMLAGVGSIGGLVIAGLALGLLDAVLPVLISGAASSAISVAIVVVLLLIRPQGFFGHEA
jgi:branched-chain amino acid transport system permease protein